jgi:tRNA C32,U32 (ribose-2'-O)-methylase TrmJ
MAAGIESLNAAAAATLMFYEWRRRRSGSSDFRQEGGVPRKGESVRARMR